MAPHKIAQDHVGPEWPRTDQVGPDPANVVEELSAPKLIGGTPSLCRSTTQLVVRPSSGRWRKDPPCISRLPLDRYQLRVEEPLPIPRRPVVGCLRPRVDDDLVDQQVQQLPAPLQAMRPHAFSSVMAGEVPSSGELAATRSMARPSVSKRAERRFWPPGIRQTSAGRSNRAPESRAAGFACLVLCEVPAKGAGFLGLRDKVRKRRAVEPEVHSLTAQKVLRWALELRLASAS